MKLDLKVGQYIRLNYGTIDKILKITESYVQGVSQKETPIAYNRDNIIKASDELIDLIEKDDIVKVRIDNMFINYFIVDTFEDDEENEILGIACYEDGMLNTISEYRPLNTLEILEVLTHEQFEQMSYKNN